MDEGKEAKTEGERRVSSTFHRLSSSTSASGKISLTVLSISSRKDISTP